MEDVKFEELKLRRRSFAIEVALKFKPSQTELYNPNADNRGYEEVEKLLGDAQAILNFLERKD